MASTRSMPAGWRSACTGLCPARPLGCLMLLQQELGDLTGLDAIVVGRSNIVGKPMAQLLLQASCTVTIAHSRTRDLPARRAALRHRRRRGRPARAHPRRLDQARRDGHRRRAGARRAARRHAQASRRCGVRRSRRSRGCDHPGPGGVGPMTIACLIRNTFVSAARREGFPTTRKAYDRRTPARRLCSDRHRRRICLRARCAADRPMDRVPQICRSRRGDVHSASGVGARFPPGPQGSADRSAGGRRTASFPAMAARR